MLPTNLSTDYFDAQMITAQTKGMQRVANISVGNTAKSCPPIWFSTSFGDSGLLWKLYWLTFEFYHCRFTLGPLQCEAQISEEDAVTFYLDSGVLEIDLDNNIVNDDDLQGNKVTLNVWYDISNVNVHVCNSK